MERISVVLGVGSADGTPPGVFYFGALATALSDWQAARIAFGRYEECFDVSE